MATFAQNILVRFRKYLNEDCISLLDKINDPGEWSDSLDESKEARKRFASFLISVSTHPIGLRASVSPFNSEQEHMLAYLMGMFNIKQKQLEKMLTGTGVNSKSPITSEKRHSWRVGIKFRLGPPVFNERSQEYLDNLTVRVYLFQEKPLHAANRKGSRPSESSPTSGSPSIKSFFTMMTKAKTNQSTRIRPASDKYFELKFRNDSEEGLYRAVLVKTDDQKLVDYDNGDICMNIRRHYAEGESAYIMRFEYWLDDKVVKMSSFKRLTQYATKSNACCLFTRDRPSPSSQTGDEIFYGYVNINLSQIPSYATKRSCPILSILGRHVNSSEICMEFKNRQLISANSGNYFTPTSPNSKKVEAKARITPEQANDDFVIVNHLRLYANCLIYQIILLKLDGLISSDDLETLTSSITFDNLIYLPAHTLINQHRLQSNLRPLEDQSLRRSAILLLLIKLAEGPKSSKKNSMRLATLLLISIVQHEYLIAHRLFDNRTMQELEVFDEDLSSDNSRESILEIEQLSIVEFFDKFISREQLSGDWLKNLFTTPPHLGKAITLSSLRFVKSLIEHYRRNKLVNSEQRHNVLKLEARAEKLLADAITSDIKSKMHDLLAGSDATLGQSAQVKPRENLRAKRTRKSTGTMMRSGSGGGVTNWQQLAGYTQRIDHDLSLHWSKKGFGCLTLDSSKMLEQAIGSAGSKEAKSLTSTIKAKLKRYLAEESA